MDTGSTCPNCGYRTEQVLITCPRCRQQMQHNHCNHCGRCPGHGKKQNEKRENAEG